MITYNQENLISETLDSLLSQNILPYEVIIGDDCSQDDTWTIIEKYKNKYPSIIKCIRHEKNIGIYNNINYLLPLPSGDIVSLLSGDDLYKPGIFKAFNEEIISMNLDPQDENFVLVPNYITLFITGEEIITSNYILKDEDPFKMKLRNDLIFRDVGFSIKLFRNFPKFENTFGLHADHLQSMNLMAVIDNFYFINKAYPVYRIGQGIASKTKQELSIQSRLKVIEEIKIRFFNKLDNKDLLFLEFKVNYYSYFSDESLRKLLKYFYFLLLNIGNFTPNKSFISELKQYFFLIIKKVLTKMNIYNFVKEFIKTIK